MEPLYVSVVRFLVSLSERMAAVELHVGAFFG